VPSLSLVRLSPSNQAAHRESRWPCRPATMCRCSVTARKVGLLRVCHTSRRLLLRSSQAGQIRRATSTRRLPPRCMLRAAGHGRGRGRQPVRDRRGRSQRNGARRRRVPGLEPHRYGRLPTRPADCLYRRDSTARSRWNTTRCATLTRTPTAGTSRGSGPISWAPSTLPTGASSRCTFVPVHAVATRSSLLAEVPSILARGFRATCR
jgi:hypothetical protein